MFRLIPVLAVLFCNALTAFADAPALWFLSHDTLYRLESSSGSIALTVPLKSVGAMASDSQGAVWVTADKQLLKLSAGGSTGFQADLKTVGLQSASALAVDPFDGSLWATDGKALVLLDANGTRLGSYAAPFADIRQAALGLDQSLWLLGNKRLARVARSGRLLASFDLRSVAHSEPKFLAVDDLRNRVWLAGEKELVGLAMADMRIATPSVTLTETVRGLVLQPYTGSVWTVGKDRLAEHDQHGIAGADIDLRPLGISGGNALTFDPLDQRLWLAHQSGVTAVSAQGEVLAAFATQQKIDGIVAEPFFLLPQLSLLAPPDGWATNNPRPEVRLRFDAVCNGQPCGLSPSILPAYTLDARLSGQAIGASFTFDAATGTASYVPAARLPEGLNTLSAWALDAFGHSSNSVSAAITIDTAPPAALAANLVSVAAPNASGIAITGAAGSVEAGTRLRIANLRSGETAEVWADANGAFAAVVAGKPGDRIRITVLDAAGNESVPATLAVPDSGPLPPDPATVAPPVDPGATTRLASSTAFLYTGQNPIQTGVAPGTIEARRATVLRGKVLDRDGQPLPGAAVTILDHPEFGQTLSRADGMFDLAANGGGYLTVNFAKSGYLPVQRTVNTPWQDYAPVPDVAMTPLDTRATAVDLSTAQAMQVARGNPVTDRDGQRQATLLVPEGTSANLILPDGSVRPLSAMTVRATEFTVGDAGPRAMPGPLPPASGYTYAVEYSVDEALAAGASSIRFSRPVYHYVDNFLGFPVGGIVPAGYYDRRKAAWIPSDNGVVVKIVSVANGLAEIDSDGDGQADEATRLSAMDVTDAERAQLATLYAPGKSLWRVPMTHFTPWDCNWPYGPPDGAEAPPLPTPSNPSPVDNPDCQAGSVVECQNQSLGESVPISGTSFRLNYKSSRMPGSDVLSIPIALSGPELPVGVKRIELDVDVAGGHFARTFVPQPNLKFTFVWDRRDVYGRFLPGAHTATIRVAYVYEGQYRDPATLSRSFGNFGNSVMSANRARGEVILSRYSTVTLGNWLALALGLGGWTLDNLHFYDFGGQVLHFGDGTTRRAANLGEGIATIAGGEWQLGILGRRRPGDIGEPVCADAVGL